MGNGVRRYFLVSNAQPHAKAMRIGLADSRPAPAARQRMTCRRCCFRLQPLAISSTWIPAQQKRGHQWTVSEILFSHNGFVSRSASNVYIRCLNRYGRTAGMIFTVKMELHSSSREYI